MRKDVIGPVAWLAIDGSHQSQVNIRRTVWTAIVGGGLQRDFDAIESPIEADGEYLKQRTNRLSITAGNVMTLIDYGRGSRGARGKQPEQEWQSLPHAQIPNPDELEATPVE